MQLSGLDYIILMWATVHLLFNIDWKRKLPIGWNFAEVNQIQFRLLSFLLENHIQYYRSIGKLWKKIRLFAYHSIKKLKVFFWISEITLSRVIFSAEIASELSWVVSQSPSTQFSKMLFLSFTLKNIKDIYNGNSF